MAHEQEMVHASALLALRGRWSGDLPEEDRQGHGSRELRLHGGAVVIIRKALIICGLMSAGATSAIGTLFVLRSLEDNGDTVLIEPEPKGLVMAALGPIGTLIASLRWIYWALDSRGGPVTPEEQLIESLNRR